MRKASHSSADTFFQPCALQELFAVMEKKKDCCKKFKKGKRCKKCPARV
jgi:hypothetical protein